MKTEENNKLIAEFLVNNEGNLVKIRDGVYSTIDDNEVPDDDLTINDLKFHSDWNWLMQVVDKIYEMNLYYDRYIDYNSSMISDGKINLGTRINRVYEQVVEFIKWYNENSAKNN